MTAESIAEASVGSISDCTVARAFRYALARAWGGWDADEGICEMKLVVEGGGGDWPCTSHVLGVAE